MVPVKVRNLIEALGQHEDQESIKVLEEMGTNSIDDEMRELTARALVRKNVADSLSLMIARRGKGINDLSANVAMATINELLKLKDKAIAITTLKDTMEHAVEEELKETAKSVLALMTFNEKE